MNLAQDLGMPELKQACEDHVINTMSVSNACIFLMSGEHLNSAVNRLSTILNFIPTFSVERKSCTIFYRQMYNVHWRKCQRVCENECLFEHIKRSFSENNFLGLCKCPESKSIKQKFKIKCPTTKFWSKTEIFNAFEIIVLISFQLCLEEEDVWRAALNWSKYQAGVTQPLAHWTEEERVRVCKHLSPIIGHIRILLIDSKVFAEEIEPTGCVPMELSLERYRYAALQCSGKLPGGAAPLPPGRIKGEIDKKLTPRLSLNFFPGSNILRNEKMIFQSSLNSWYGNSKQTWRMIYKASIHGFSSAAFHRHCDGIAPLFIIAVVSNSNYFYS